MEEKIETLVSPIIHKLNYEIYDVSYVKEGKDYFLRITIDKEQGISIDDCEIVSRAIDEVLDNADFIKESYFLEVSSPGIERVLRKTEHFEKQIGKEIHIKLFKPIERKKEWVGFLKKVSEDILELEVEKQIIRD